MPDRIDLPPPDWMGGPLFELTLSHRRSVREFQARDLTRAEIGQLLWAAQGITDKASGFRAAPSAGALYPLEIDAVTRDGVFRYQPRGHALIQRDGKERDGKERDGKERDGKDIRAELARAALGQECIANAPCVFAITSVAVRTTRKYGSRGIRYIHIEAGHAAQNLLLQAQALGLAGVPVGAFDDDAVARVLRIAREEEPLYLLPVGWPLRPA